MQVHYLPVSWSSHAQALEAIRAKVFIDEQSVPEEVERDGQDEGASHFLAIDEAGQQIGCARLLPDGQIGRMAVLPERRGKGVGFKLLELAVAEAQKLGFTEVFLNAQTHAERFYRRAGFMPVGKEFMEAGIPHQRMELRLPIPFEAQNSGLDTKPLVREETPHPDVDAGAVISHQGEGACRDGVLATLDHPSRQVRIYSQLLDHALFDDEHVVSALSAFVRHGPPAHMRVLIHSASAIVSRGHRVVELARRLVSKIDIRQVPAELAQDRHTFVVADTTAFFLMPDFTDYQGFSNIYDPVEASQLAERFDHLWERSQENPELRTLRI